MNNIENNKVIISGEIVSSFNFSHELYGENFYIVDVKIRRFSDTCDIIHVMVSDRMIDTDKDFTGECVSVTGQFRSYNKHDGERNLLILSLFARDFDLIEIEECGNSNIIELDGFVCKEPKYRETPLGREITDMLLAVNRGYGKSDYIPCITWGRNARFAGNLEVGTRIKVSGRLQSRDYIKRYADGREDDRTAYEVSVSKLEVVEDAD